MKYSFEILGKIPSKSNCYRIVRHRGRYTSALAKADGLTEYERNFSLQNPYSGKMIAQGRFRLTVEVWFQSDKPDLDNSLKILLDCLQADGTIGNDRRCMEIHAIKAIDRKNPRVRVCIEPEEEEDGDDGRGI